MVHRLPGLEASVVCAVSRGWSRWIRRLRPAGLVLIVACQPLTGTEGQALEVVGTWRYSASQLAPQWQMTGEVEFRSQRGSDVVGTARWEARDAMGAVLIGGGPVSGRVIGLGDIDFDVEATDGSRRHVARFVTADSMEGVWVQSSDGRSGDFYAGRGQR